MKKYINNIAIVSLVMLLLTSCADDFLEKTNPNQQSTDNFWRNNVDLNSGLTSVYHALARENIMNLNGDNSRADCVYPGFRRDIPWERTLAQFYEYSYADGNANLNNKWSDLYAVCFRANQVIVNGQNLIASYTDEDLITEATQIVAQARFLRGWAYFALYNTFNEGSVIIFDFVPENESEFYQSLSDASTVEAFFLADLNYARENLPPRWNENVDKGRVTAGTATAVLGKHYLYTKDYTRAREMFNDVITNSDYGYQLTAHIGDNFSEAGENNSESIFEIGYSTTLKAEENGWGNIRNVSNTYNTATGSREGAFRTILPSAWIAVAYRNEVMDTQDPRNYVDSLVFNGPGPGTPVIDPDTNRPFRVLRDFSLRASYSVALPDDFDTPHYQREFASRYAGFGNDEYAYYRKYNNWETVTAENTLEVNGAKSPLNVRLIRLADVFLMQAEALIEAGNNQAGFDEALTLVNRVRRRSGLQLLGPNGTGLFPANDHDDIAYDANSLMQHIMYIERPLELSIEGHSVRFIDLRRWDVVEERFADLSARRYHRRDVPYVDSDGDQQTNFGSAIYDGEINPITGQPDALDVRDNVVANERYDAALHAYYPIPNGESQANPTFNDGANNDNN